MSGHINAQSKLCSITSEQIVKPLQYKSPMSVGVYMEYLIAVE